MSRFKQVVTLVFALSSMALALFSCKPAQKDYRVCAFIWPSCHDDSLAHELLWPEGIGEWQIINKATPRFEGHLQPKQPLWGCEADDDPEVVEKWIQTALEYGVNTFVYDWYWYMDQPFLEGALDDGFLKARSCEKMDFYVMWANHDVPRNYWNCYRYGDDKSQLFSGDVTPEQFETICDRVIEKYFWRKNYAKIDGKPIFMIYSLDDFMESFGGDLHAAAEAIEAFRGKCRNAGYPGLYIQCSIWTNGYLNERYRMKCKEIVEALGIDSFASYNMGGTDVDYQKFCSAAVDLWDCWDKLLSTADVFPTVSIGWDDTPRFPAKGEADVCHVNRTPDLFRETLQKAKDYADCHPEQPKFIYINAWNEWVEDSYLLPDKINGFAYLEAVRDVIKPEKN